MDRQKVPRTKELEFGGSLGAALLLLLLPATVFYLLLVCRTEQASLFSLPLPPPPLHSLWSPQDLALVLGWIGLQAVLYVLPTGKLAEGIPLRDQSRLQYRINGSRSMWLTALAVGASLAAGLPLSYIYDHLLQLAFSAFLVALGLSVFLYLKALAAPESALAPGGNSGNLIYDFFMGRELNPRIGTFDLKFFCELRPGLLGWVGPDQHGHAGEGDGAEGQPLLGHDPRQRLPAPLRGGRLLARGGHPHHHGHCARRLRLHAGLRGPGLGALLVQPAGPLPGDPPAEGFPPHGCRHRPPQWPGLLHLPWRQLPEKHFPPEPCRPPSRWPPDHPHGHGAASPGVRLVGVRTAPQLLGGPDHGACVVLALWSDSHPSLFLHPLLHRAADPPGGPGRAPVPEEVWLGLAGILSPCPLSDLSVPLLSCCMASPPSA